MERHDADGHTLVSSGLNGPQGVAVDAAGNVYIADTDNNAIKEWNATTQRSPPWSPPGWICPCGVAVDGAGNVYIADTATTRSRSGTPRPRRSPPWSPRG